MAIKESSDELNPPTFAAESIPVSPRPPRTAKDYLALAIATCGVGYLPLAPGTWGSLVGIGVYMLVRGAAMTLFFGIGGRRNFNLLHVYYGVIAIELVAILAIFTDGTWAASRTESCQARKIPASLQMRLPVSSLP